MEYLHEDVTPTGSDGTWPWMRILAGGTGSQFKGIKMLADLDMNNNNIINWSGSAGPTPNITASNLGSGSKAFVDKQTNTLRFRSLKEGSTKLSITEQTDDIKADLGIVKLVGDIEDVEVPTAALATGNILEYNATLSKWQAKLPDTVPILEAIWRPNGGSTTANIITGNAAVLNTFIKNNPNLGIVYVDMSYATQPYPLTTRIQCYRRVRLVGLPIGPIKRNPQLGTSDAFNIQDPEAVIGIDFIKPTFSSISSINLYRLYDDKYDEILIKNCTFTGSAFQIAGKLPIPVTSQRPLSIVFDGCTFDGSDQYSVYIGSGSSTGGFRVFFKNNCKTSQGTITSYKNMFYINSTVNPVPSATLIQDISSRLGRISDLPNLAVFMSNLQDSPGMVIDTSTVVNIYPGPTQKTIVGITYNPFYNDNTYPWPLEKTKEFLYNQLDASRSTQKIKRGSLVQTISSLLATNSTYVITGDTFVNSTKANTTDTISFAKTGVPSSNARYGMLQYPGRAGTSNLSFDSCTLEVEYHFEVSFSSALFTSIQAYVSVVVYQIGGTPTVLPATYFSPKYTMTNGEIIEMRGHIVVNLPFNFQIEPAIFITNTTPSPATQAIPLIVRYWNVREKILAIGNEI